MPPTSAVSARFELLEAIRDVGISTKFYQASSSEMFGDSSEYPQRELTGVRSRARMRAKVLDIGAL
jgi:GDP-D-mannose dehydratase